MKKWKVLFAIGCGLIVAGCGGGDSSEVTPANFAGNWGGSSNGTTFKFAVAQTGSSLSMTRIEPASAGVTYTGTVNGNSAAVDTRINGVLAATSTLTLVDPSTATMTVNTCTPPPGTTCAAPGSTLTVTR